MNSKYRIEEWYGEWVVIKGDTVVIADDSLDSREKAEEYVRQLEEEAA